MALDPTTTAAPAALMAHRTNCRICLSPTKAMYSMLVGRLFRTLAADARIAAGAFSARSDGGDESEPTNTRAAMHTHISWQNDYFVLTDNTHIFM